MKQIREYFVECGKAEGFQIWGFANAKPGGKGYLEKRQDYLALWLKQNQHAAMFWLNRHWELRKDISNVFNSAKTVISFALVYGYEEPDYKDKARISQYAIRKDYHKVIKKKLQTILTKAQTKFNFIKGRVCVDTAPIDEKGWALECGLGFIGKNTLLIHPDFGSFLLLGEILLNIKIEENSGAQKTATRGCGKCRRCIDACPTNALEPYRLNANLCISYLTIEAPFRDQAEPPDIARKGWVFGCDICQEVCPINRKRLKIIQNKIQTGQNWEKIIPPTFPWQNLLELTEKKFLALFQETPVKRIGFDKFNENVEKAYSLHLSG